MKDLQVITVVDDLRVTSATQVADVPRTVLLRTNEGGFAEAQRVEGNSLGIDAFQVVSDTAILVVLPDTLSELEVSQIAFVVLGGEATLRRRVRLVNAFTRRPRAVSGIQKLVQQVVRVLLTTPGTNRFSPTRGGGLIAGLEQVSTDGGDLAIAMAQAVQLTESYVRAAQRTARRLPANERLRSLRFEGLTYDQDVAVANVLLEDFTGAARAVPVVL